MGPPPALLCTGPSFQQRALRATSALSSVTHPLSTASVMEQGVAAMRQDKEHQSHLKVTLSPESPMGVTVIVPTEESLRCGKQLKQRGQGEPQAEWSYPICSNPRSGSLNLGDTHSNPPPGTCPFLHPLPRQDPRCSPCWANGTMSWMPTS